MAAAATTTTDASSTLTLARAKELVTECRTTSPGSLWHACRLFGAMKKHLKDIDMASKKFPPLGLPHCRKGAIGVSACLGNSYRSAMWLLVTKLGFLLRNENKPAQKTIQGKLTLGDLFELFQPHRFGDCKTCKSDKEEEEEQEEEEDASSDENRLVIEEDEDSTEYGAAEKGGGREEEEEEEESDDQDGADRSSKEEEEGKEGSGLHKTKTTLLSSGATTEFTAKNPTASAYLNKLLGRPDPATETTSTLAVQKPPAKPAAPFSRLPIFGAEIHKSVAKPMPAVAATEPSPSATESTSWLSAATKPPPPLATRPVSHAAATVVAVTSKKPVAPVTSGAKPAPPTPTKATPKLATAAPCSGSSNTSLKTVAKPTAAAVVAKPAAAVVAATAKPANLAAADSAVPTPVNDQLPPCSRCKSEQHYGMWQLQADGTSHLCTQCMADACEPGPRKNALLEIVKYGVMYDSGARKTHGLLLCDVKTPNQYHAMNDDGFPDDSFDESIGIPVDYLTRAKEQYEIERDSPGTQIFCAVGERIDQMDTYEWPKHCSACKEPTEGKFVSFDRTSETSRCVSCVRKRTADIHTASELVGITCCRYCKRTEIILFSSVQVAVCVSCARVVYVGLFSRRKTSSTGIMLHPLRLVFTDLAALPCDIEQLLSRQRSHIFDLLKAYSMQVTAQLVKTKRLYENYDGEFQRSIRRKVTREILGSKDSLEKQKAELAQQLAELKKQTAELETRKRKYEEAQAELALDRAKIEKRMEKIRQAVQDE